MNTKVCIGCKIEKSLDDFYNTKASKDKKQSRCKSCTNKYTYEWINSNRQRLNKVRGKWRQDNPDKIKKHRNKTTNSDGYKEWIKEYKNINRDKINDYARKWRNLNPLKVKESIHKWINKNPDKQHIYNANRRARINKNGGKIDIKEWQELCNKYDNRCLSCGKKIKITIDHVIPLALGGSNTIDNAQPLCKSCNSSKGTKIIDYRTLIKD